VLILRSAAFNVLFYSNLVLHIILALPTFALPRGAFMALARSWGRTSNLLLRVIAGRGREGIGLNALLLPSFQFLRQQMQIAVVETERLKRMHGREHVFTVGAGLAVALPHQM
jgi:hypothetical protein